MAAAAGPAGGAEGLSSHVAEQASGEGEAGRVSIPFVQDHQQEQLSSSGQLQINGLTFARHLGKGAFATVALAEAQQGVSPVAVKCFSKSQLSRKRDVHRDSTSGGMTVTTALDKVESEFSIMSRLGKHENLVCLLGAIDAPDSDDLYYVLEFVSGGVVMEYDEDVHRFISALTGGTLPEPLVQQIGRDAARGLAHAHELHIVHRDIKPDNLFVSAEGVVKVGDWGVAHDATAVKAAQAMAQALDTVAETVEGGGDIAAAEARIAAHVAALEPDPDDLQCRLRGTEGTFQFLSPAECSAPAFDGYKADVWALCVTLWTLLTGQVPFGASASNPMDLFAAIEHDPLPPKPPCMSDGAYAFFRAGLTKADGERPSMQGLLKHAWLSPSSLPERIPWKALETSALPPFKSPKMAFLKLAKASGTDSPGGSPHGRADSAVSEGTLSSIVARGASRSMAVPSTDPLKCAQWAQTLAKVVLHGWLFKRGRLRKTWKRRYCVLSVPCEGKLPHPGVEEPCLTYFKEDPNRLPSAAPKGCMPLANFASAMAQPKPQKPARFMVAAGGREMYLQAGTQEAMEQWVQAFNRVATAEQA